MYKLYFVFIFFNFYKRGVMSVVTIFVFVYMSVLIFAGLVSLYFFLKYDAVVICPEKIASKLQKEWNFENCKHDNKFIGHLNNRYIEKCDDCGELLVEEYAKTLPKHA
tara:strand:- start:86 stop:409 length:324 start_codon:yes stop_codon:yes gene_type:complete